MKLMHKLKQEDERPDDGRCNVRSSGI